jgi:general stress protein 26
MDSINRQQAEENRKNLFSQEAIDKIKEITDKNDVCFFCTELNEGGYMTVRPMSVQKVDEEGNLWFLSAIDSHKNQEIQADHKVQLLFQASKHSGFLSIEGTATISQDKAKIEELWEPLVKTWFTEGKDDPRITVIKVTPESGYYWDNKHGNAIAFLKMTIGAISGKTLDDSIEGTVNVR